MRHIVFMVASIFLIAGVRQAEAQEFDLLTKEDFAAIEAEIGKFDKAKVAKPAKLEPQLSIQSADLDKDGPTKGICKLAKFTMTLESDDAKETFPVLADSDNPNVLMLRRKEFAVDADGSPRAYHPLDGYGVCAPGPNGPCALDNLNGSAGVQVCGKPKGSSKATCYKKEEFAAQFAKLWPDIKSKKPTKEEKQRYEYLTGDGRFIVSFKNNIIPQNTKDRSPCLNNLGYFLSISSLTKAVSDGESQEPAGCSYVTPNAEVLPFMVIPKSAFASVGNGSIAVGDMAIVHYEKEGRVWRVYAVVGDEGPAAAFGEGSMGLSQMLRDNKESIKNRLDLEAKLHIGSGIVTLLVIGGSRSKLGGKYEQAHIDAVGEELFKSWVEGAKMGRFESCRLQLTPK